MRSANTNAPDVLVNFYDNYVPALKDGQYTIKLSQALTVDLAQTTKDEGDIKVPKHPAPDVTQTFVVQGPRFGPLLLTDISQKFPPPGNAGAYERYLPQLVLSQQALPWERGLNLKDSQLPAGVSAAQIPWVALLVFAEGELLDPQRDQPGPALGGQANPTRTSTITLKALTTPDPTGKRLDPALTLDEGQDDTQTCRVIEMPVAVFNALMPSVGDLRYLAHTREVGLKHKAHVTGQNGWFSAVIGNRFAVPPGGAARQMTNAVHLVSLEGFETQLCREGPPQVRGATESVRMVSLFSWAFNCQVEPAENFNTLMLKLISESSDRGTKMLLRLPTPTPAEPDPDPATAETVRGRLRRGHVPLSYAMLSGDQTFAWYRGPLAPVPVPHYLAAAGPGQPPNPAVPYTSAEAMVYEPATGLFDQSYAVAFQVGRSLALASQSFATSLLSWRRGAHHAVDVIQEQLRSPVYAPRLRQSGLLHANGTIGAATGVTELAKLLNPNLVTAAFQEYFTEVFPQRLAFKVGRKDGYRLADHRVMLRESPPPTAVAAGPAGLLGLMQQPIVANLLEHLAGLDQLGTLAAPLKPGDTELTLQGPGTSEALAAGLNLILYSPDGTISGWLTVARKADARATRVAIKPYAGTLTQPAGSTLRLNETSEDAAQVAQWLAATALLYNVPFNNLVAHPDLLPQDSIRFFYLDANWIDALLDGALSIGQQTKRDTMFQGMMRKKLYASVHRELAQARDTLLGVAGAGRTPAAVAPAGFLLRARGVAGWPGREIQAWSAADAENPMKPLRLDTIADGVMLALYPDIPTKVTFTEPTEGLVFGYEDRGVALRYVPGMAGCTPANVGAPVKGHTWVSPADIASARRSSTGSAALNIAGLVQLLQGRLPGAKAGLMLSPASFAVQMVRVPEQLVFTPASTTSQS